MGDLGMVGFKGNILVTLISLEVKLTKQNLKLPKL